VKGRLAVAGRINDADIRALRERANIGVVIGEYTALKRAGSKLKGLCPFHGEKTPSFTVDPARGLWHCFGCGEGGDTYGFLQKIEALSFPEAVERLARLTGFELRYEELSPGQRKALGRRTRLVDAVEAAAEFFTAKLATPDGEAARSYLASRGIDAAAAHHFRLGWAPDSWDALVRHLVGLGYEHAEIVEAGVATPGKRGLIDRFRGRVIFPIIERGGRDVVAFGGRILPGVELATGPRDGTPPKYINSSETEVYKKSETLYGLNWARAEIQSRRSAIVVEGYMDVIGMHLGGIRNVVATCGTALTADHFRHLEKFTPRVILALDADDAGYAAADRARALAEEVGIGEVGVLPLPPGEDPADLAARGREAVEEALRHTKTAVEFQIEHLLRGADVDSPEGQVAAYRRTFPLLAQLHDRFLRFTYVRDIVAPAVRLSADRIERELDEHRASTPVASPASRAGSAHGGAGGPAPPAGAGPGGGQTTAPRSPQLKMEREVLQAAIQHGDIFPVEWKLVTADDFTAAVSKQLFTALRDAPPGDLEAVLAVLPDDDSRARVRALALSETTVKADPAHLRRLICDLRVARVTREIAEVRSELGRLNTATDPDRSRELTIRHTELERAKRELAEGRDA
jgi:DNA primase